MLVGYVRQIALCYKQIQTAEDNHILKYYGLTFPRAPLLLLDKIYFLDIIYTHIHQAAPMAAKLCLRKRIIKGKEIIYYY